MSEASSHTSVIRSVTVRVAGEVLTEAFAHHYDTPSQEVGVRAGDTLTYVHAGGAAAAIAAVFGTAASVAARELPRSVSPTWLGIDPGTYPPGLLLRYGTLPTLAIGHQPRRCFGSDTAPAHVWVRVGPVCWQLCDQRAAERLAQVWASCARLLHTPTSAPTALTAPGAALRAAAGAAAGGAS